jgi:hypothetical protein
VVYVVGKVWVPSWSWSYGSWIYNSLCNQCLTVSQFHLHPHPFLLTGVKIHVHVYLTWNQELLTKPSSTWVGWLDLLWNVFVIYCKHNYFFHPSSDFNPELNVNRVLRHFIPLDSQPQVIKFTSCLPMVGGSLRALRLLPPLKLVAMI